MTTVEPTEDTGPQDDFVIPPVAPTLIERSPESIRVGARLDEHHAPETNGWMSVCRRCGIRTDGPEGSHAPHALQIEQGDRWVDAAVRATNIASLKEKRDT